MINTLKLAEVKAVVAPEGRTILVIGPGCWGKGKDGAAALKACVAASGLKDLFGDRVMVYEAAADAWIDNDGGICWTQGEERSRELMRGKLSR